MVFVVLLPACREPAQGPAVGKEVKMPMPDSPAAKLAAEIARRLAEAAATRPRLVVYIERFGQSPMARDTQTALEKFLVRNGRIALSRLADGVSVPGATPSGHGYSEAIGLRIPTPSPDVTVQLTDVEGGVEAYAVRHTGPSRSERLFQLGHNP
jgi:hypothetical protein